MRSTSVGVEYGSARRGTVAHRPQGHAASARAGDCAGRRPSDQCRGALRHLPAEQPPGRPAPAGATRSGATRPGATRCPPAAARRHRAPRRGRTGYGPARCHLGHRAGPGGASTLPPTCERSRSLRYYSRSIRKDRSPSPSRCPTTTASPLGTKVLWLDGEEPRWAEVEEILPTGELWMTLVHLGEVTGILGRTSDARAASVLDCAVLTGDPEFRVAEEAGVANHWLGRRASRPSPDCGWSRRPTSTDLWRIRNPLGARGPTSATGSDCGARPRSPPGSRLHSAPSEPLPCHDTTRAPPASQAGVRRCPGGPCR